MRDSGLRARARAALRFRDTRRFKSQPRYVIVFTIAHADRPLRGIQAIAVPIVSKVGETFTYTYVYNAFPQFSLLLSLFFPFFFRRISLINFSVTFP